MVPERAILVNELDEPIGSSEKLQCHKNGSLHRAVSGFIFNHNGELLVQKRATSKYHEGSLWTNTCCTHPRHGETSESSAKRRLKEEMGIEATVEEKFSFVYKAEVENGLVENEYDHVFFGIYKGPISPNSNEVEDYTFVQLDKVFTDADNYPNKYSIWFRTIIDKFRNHFIGLDYRQMSIGV